MPKLNWIAGPDDALCASGYPIRIRRGKPFTFILDVDGRAALLYATLSAAKSDAEWIADELDEFTAPQS